ncbi:MAG: hypothetical protein JWO12_1769 [Frankiales bacterium]|nr:hypothetical protein [Frankiales bacterium]
MTPEQHRPPVYACAAGAVLHAHSADTLEPAVVLYTFLPSGSGDRIDSLDAKVDVHGDGPGTSTLTVRVLSEGQSLSWQLPIAPFVAALPGQPGDDGRMVLLAVMDAEPDEGFWAQPVDCERLAAELQLPVTDLADALRGRLTPWLADDVDLLLHDDAHEHAADHSPAQTLARAVLAHYRGDLEADQASTRLLQAFDYAHKDFSAELGARLCVALNTAIVVAGPEAIAQVIEQTGPFEPEVTRLLTELPAKLRPDDPEADDPDTTAGVLLSGGDHQEALKAAVTAVARLGRTAFGEGLPDEEVLRRLSMVSDAGQARIASLWVDLAVAAAGAADADPVLASDLATRVEQEGGPGGAWLRSTAAALGAYALDLQGRGSSRVAEPVRVLDAFLADRPRAGQAITAEVAAGALRQCLTLARFVRTRGGISPGFWRQVPVESAAQAVGTALAKGLSTELAVDLLDTLLADDVEGPDVLEAFVCVTAQLLVEVDPHEPAEGLQAKVDELLAAVPGGNRGPRWLMLACLNEAPDHDPAATDLRPYLPKEAPGDVDKIAFKLGRRGVLASGLTCVDVLAGVVGAALEIPREELLGLVLPGALVEHELLAPPPAP